MKNQSFKPFVSARASRRRKGTARLFVLSAAFATTVAGASSADAQGIRREPALNADASGAGGSAAQRGTAVRLDIPAGPLGAAIVAFESATGIKVAVANEMIRDLPAAALSGVFTPQEALDRLLNGTGVGFVFTGRNAVMLDIRTADFVRVAGDAPGATSPKFTQPLRDVPQTITVVPAAVIEAQGATTLRDVLRNVTGISIQAGEGGAPAGDNLSIRGFNARTDLFIDGVRDTGGYTRDPFNVEQVEVVKGPSSSYSGRGSTGGSINLATKRPSLSASRHASVGIGSSDYKRGTLDLNQPVAGTDSVAFRLNAMWTDADTPGRDAVTSERWAVAPSLALGLGTPTRVTLSHSYLAQDNMPDYGIPWVPATNVPLRAYADQAPPVAFSNFYGLASRDYEDTETGTSTAIVEHDLNANVGVRSLVRYGQTRRDSLTTAPRFESNTTTAIRRTDWKSRDQRDAILASQTDVTAHFSRGATSHALVTGVEIAREASTNWTRVERAAPSPSTDLVNPNAFEPYASHLERNGAVTDGTAASAAVYAFDTVNVGSRFEISGGLRFDRLALDYLTRDAAGTDTTLGRTDHMLSWRGGAVYKPRPEGSVYVGVGTSLNPSTEGLSLNVGTVALDPERTRSYEVGTKWDLVDNRVGLTAAAFHTTKVNARTPGINPGDPATVLDGEQVVEGVEFGATGSVSDRWQLFGSYTFMDSEVTRSNNAAEVGKAFGNTPRHSMSLWTTFRLPFDVEVGGGAQYVGDRFTSNTATRVAPGYRVFDAMAAYRVSDRLTLRLNGLNLANARYIDRLYAGHFIPGPGRSVMLTSEIGF
jgi:catecholate siderophore receptor